MPRYCLFGETVTIAETLEEKSRAGSILISSAVHDALQKGTRGALSSHLAFELMPDPVLLPGRSMTTCAYFLDAKAHRRRQVSMHSPPFRIRTSVRSL